MKTAEFGVPCSSPQPGKCRVCGCGGGGPPFPSPGPVDAFVCVIGAPPNRRYCAWADHTMTLCDNPACVAEAKRELGLVP